ncbi:MAG TPA: glycosyltransferase [Clostridia bacterium]
MKSILYVTYQETPFTAGKAIIKTQVEQMLKALDNKYKKTWLMIYNSKITIPNEQLLAYKDEMKSAGVEFKPVRCRTSNIYSGIFEIRRIIKKYIADIKVDIIHCRGYPAAFAANLAKGKEKVIFDMRGVFPEEVLVNKSHALKHIEYLLWRFVEAYNINRSQKIVVVTDYFKDYIKKKYGCDEKIKLIYNCVNTRALSFSESARNEIRKELGCENKCLVVFSGSIADKWQSFDKNVQVYKKLKEKFKNTKLLVLSRNSVDLLSYGLDESESTVMYVDNDEIYKYLSAGDIGLLIRNETPVNAVAFPVKFAEYMACGLPVIINSSMKGICSIIDKKGIIFDDSNVCLEKINDVKKEDCITFARSYLDTGVISECYSVLYSSM